MTEARIDRILDQLRCNLKGAGIEVAEAELQEMIEKGCLKAVLAFDKVTQDTDLGQVPGYLGAWGDADGAEDRAAAPAALGPRRETTAVGPLGLSLQEAARRIQAGALSPVELVRASLDRIQERDAVLNAFQVVLEASALAAARVAEQEIRAGHYRGPLHGIPLAVKDILDMEGLATSAGSRIRADQVASEDATAVAKLKAAGAILVGKTRMSEFAYSSGSNNDHFGPTRNPHQLDRDTGGSSSGSAAAVADHMVFGALGTDTGGSIRIPASFCGLVGLKPTFGRLSLHGAASLAWSLDHLGPLTRTVADTTLMLEALGGFDPRDPRTRRRSGSPVQPPRDPAVKGLRIGVLGDDGSGRALANADTLAAWQRGLAALEAAGAELVPVDLPELQPLRVLNGTLLAIEAATYHLAMQRARLQDYGEFPRLRLLGGWAHGPIDFIRAQQACQVLRERCNAIFSRVEVLSMPTMPSEAPALGTPARLTFTAPFNLLGWPAISVPAGRTAEGLPLGLQLVGKPWDEATVLHVARAVEAGVGFEPAKN